MPPIATVFDASVYSAKIALLAALLAIQLSLPLTAQPVTNGAFATRGYQGRTPLSVNYSLEMPPSMSLGVVQVTIADTTGPSKEDRDLTVVLYTKCWGQGPDAIAYRYNLRLAEGQTKAELAIPFTAAEAQLAWDVSLFEAGRDIEDTRKRNTVNNVQPDYHWSTNINQTGNSISMAALIATDADPKVESRNLAVVAEFLESQAKAQNTSNRIAAAQGSVVNPNSMFPVAKASGDWRHYFPYPIWIASDAALAEIGERQPRVAAALRTYVSAGGILLAYNMQSSQSIAALNRLLSADGGNAELASWRSFGKSAPAWWIIDAESEVAKPPSEGAGATNSALQSVSGEGAARDVALLTDTLLETGLGGHRDNVTNLMDAMGFEGVSFPQLEAGRERMLRTLGSDQMLVRQYARGSVIVCSKPLNELFSVQIKSILELPEKRALSALASQNHDGNWFWKNLTIQVGKPPVWAFCVMVTLFGALLGPGLLYFTGRMQRRSLMIFLVPAVSLIATLAIVLYGVFHEGFETHLRIHSVTAYDGPAQVAFGWSRQNFFSGAPPREGLKFPVEAYVRSVSSDDAADYSGTPDPRRDISGTVSVGDVQAWTGWLKPRQHQQLLVGHQVDPRTIPIATERTPTGALMLKNLTEKALPLVILRGDRDDYYLEVDFGPNESRESEVQDLASVAVSVGRIGADFKPRIPPELDGGSDSLLNFGNPRRYARAYQVQESEIIGEAFARYLTDDLALEPHEFAALVPEFAAIAVPLQGLQADNVNLVIGVDPW